MTLSGHVHYWVMMTVHHAAIAAAHRVERLTRGQALALAAYFEWFNVERERRLR